MDMGKFYAWKYQAVIIALSTASLRPIAPGESAPRDQPYECCKAVFDLLVEDGLAATHAGGWYSLSDNGRERVSTAKREVSWRMGELLREDDRLIRKFTLRQHRKSSVYTEEEDLYQAGCMAYVHTLGKFDPGRFSDKGLGKSFTNYLESWVRHYCQQAIAGHQLIRMPRGTGMPYQMHLKAEEIRKQGREPTPEELGVTQEQIDQWAQSPVAISNYGCKGKPYMDTNNDTDEHLSRTEEGWSWASPEPSPEDQLEAAETASKVDAAMETLKPRERKVMEMLADGATYRTIATEMKVTEEYIRQIRAAAIAKLRKEIGEV